MPKQMLFKWSKEYTFNLKINRQFTTLHRLAFKTVNLKDVKNIFGYFNTDNALIWESIENRFSYERNGNVKFVMIISHFKFLIFG